MSWSFHVSSRLGLQNLEHETGFCIQDMLETRRSQTSNEFTRNRGRQQCGEQHWLRLQTRTPVVPARPRRAHAVSTVVWMCSCQNATSMWDAASPKQKAEEGLTARHRRCLVTSLSVTPSDRRLRQNASRGRFPHSKSLTSSVFQLLLPVNMQRVRSGRRTCSSRSCLTWEKTGGLSLTSPTVMVTRTAEDRGGLPSSAACTVKE